MNDNEKIHGYFGLSYANFLVLPRSLLQSMPEEWQERFVMLLNEYDQQWARLPDSFVPNSYRVQPIEHGRLIPWYAFRLPHYSRGRTHVAPDGTINGERFPP